MNVWSKRLVVPAVAVAAVSLIAACGSGGKASSGGSPASPKPVHWTLLSWSPVTQPYGKAIVAFAAEVKSKSNGLLDINVETAGQGTPLASTDALTAIKSDQVQIADAYSGFVAGSSGLAAVPQYPFLIHSVAQLVKVFPAYSPFLKSELSSKFGADLLFWYPLPMQNFFGSGSPVTSLTGLSGKKVRSTSPQQATFLKKLGATPVSLGSTELGPALSTGVVTAFSASAVFTAGAGLGGTFKWAFTPGINAAPSYIVVNQKAMSSLSASSQSALKSAASDYQSQLIGSAQPQDDAALATMTSQGVHVTPGTPQDTTQGVNLSKSLWAGFASSAGGSSPAALAAIRKAVGD